MTDPMQVDASDMTDNSSFTKAPSHSGSAVNGGEASMAATTPPRESETRRGKRSREDPSYTHADQAVVMPQEAMSPPRRPPQGVWAKPLATYMEKWLDAFSQHHVACRAIPRNVVIRLTLQILGVHIEKNGHSDQRVFKCDAVAAFWIAIKFSAARHTMPNASFITYVTATDKQQVLQAELAVLASIEWDVYNVARRANLVVDDSNEQPAWSNA